MRKAKFTIVLIVAFLLGTAADAQTYSVPRKLNLEPAAKREFKKWWISPARYPGLVPEGFYPIGWSKDGKFAYYYEPVDEACGCYFARLVIQDMRTDEKLYEFTYNQDDTMNDKGEMSGPGNVRTLWRKNQKLFDDKLREHAIVARTSVLLGKTFTSGMVYTAGTIVTMGQDEYGEDRVMKLFYTLTTKRSGSKTLAEIDNTKAEYNGTLDAGVVGVIKSPFEQRVAVVGMEINRGWEGPPHNGDIRITGASLNFK
jgi:hypothetical protein